MMVANPKYAAKAVAFSLEQLIVVDIVRAHMQKELLLKLSRSNALTRLCKMYLQENELEKESD